MEIILAILKNTGHSDAGPLTARLNAARERGIENYPGGRDAFELKLAQLATRIWGVHNMFMGASFEAFQFTLDVPGLIVETDGVLLSDSQVQWRFNASDAYPAGYTMRVTSLEDRTLDMAGEGAKPRALSRRELLEIVKRLDADEALLDVARKCRSDVSFVPLQELSKELGRQVVYADEAAVTRKLLKMVLRQ